MYDSRRSNANDMGGGRDHILRKQNFPPPLVLRGRIEVGSLLEITRRIYVRPAPQFWANSTGVSSRFGVQ